MNFWLSIGGFTLTVPKKSCFSGFLYVMYKEKVCISIENFINDFKPRHTTYVVHYVVCLALSLNTSKCIYWTHDVNGLNKINTVLHSFVFKLDDIA